MKGGLGVCRGYGCSLSTVDVHFRLENWVLTIHASASVLADPSMDLTRTQRAHVYHPLVPFIAAHHCLRSELRGPACDSAVLQTPASRAAAVWGPTSSRRSACDHPSYTVLPSSGDVRNRIRRPNPGSVTRAAPRYGWWTFIRQHGGYDRRLTTSLAWLHT